MWYIGVLPRTLKTPGFGPAAGIRARTGPTKGFTLSIELPAMADVPRRRALLAAASGIAALAGCAGSDSASNSYPVRGDQPIDGYELERARDESGEPILTGGEETPSSETDERGRRRPRARRVLVSGDGLDALDFAETAAADRLRSFLDGTDFESASAYLLSMPVTACRDVRLRSVAVEPSELADGDLHPRADFCRAYRPADVECDPEAVHTVGFAIRLPVAAERSSGSGMGMRGSCRQGDPPAVFNSSAPGAGGDGE